MKKLNAVFFGTPEFSVPTLEFLANSDSVDLKHVVTMPDRPAGRGNKLTSPAVATYAKQNNIPLTQTVNINKEAEVLDNFDNLDIDIIIVLAFAQFLGNRILNLPKIGCFNIHTSLLPKYRGAAPIQYALLNGDNETGVSIQKMVKKMDAGDLVVSLPVKIEDNYTAIDLSSLLQNSSPKACETLLHKILNDDLVFTPQNEENVSFAPVIKKQDGLLDFDNYSAIDLHNRMRAFTPWPATYCFLNGQRLKVLETEVSKTQLKTGEVDQKFDSLTIGCLEGSLRLRKVQLPGKKPCSDSDLLRGLNNKGEKIIISSTEV